ncbi:hypothetical protein DICVIV_08108 [Dictyocaulus viviparus]|uniref:Uncharacterized protein n=1 Tax=Dictyocaulus viviparus TaxID=29172 RepID=A0A0D8XQ28_DICVI|nr:hypothetical protein DICVIV_08108 [Dictyocaulus viviparus]
MIHRGAEVDDDHDDNDGPSEATIVLSSKMSADFRKAFPLRDESIARRPTPIGTSTLSQISKRLNFEDSFSSRSVLSPSMNHVELTDEVGVLRRKLLNAHNDIQRLKTLKNDEERRAENLQKEIVHLREEFIKESNSVELDKTKRELDEVMLSRNEWRDAAICFYRYFQCSKARLTVAEKEMCSKGLMNSSLKHALDSAWTSTEYSVQDIQGNLHEVIKSVVSTLEEIDSNLQVETDSGQSLLRDSISPILSVRNEGNDSFFHNASESILNSTLANTSIDYEKDERLQRLELENSRLKDEKYVLHERAQKFLLIEEQKHSAEHKCHLLEKCIEEILGELNSLRSACKRKLFDLDDCSSEDRAAEVTRRMQSLADRVELLEKQRETACSEAEKLEKVCESLTSERDVLLKRVDHLTCINENLKSCLNDEKERCTTLKRTVELRNNDLETIQNEVITLRSRVVSLESMDLNPRNVETDAGDETQILHLRVNPMQCAVHDLLEAEKGLSRKRKADPYLGSDEPCDVKRAREEHINALENQLKKSEREKEETIRLQTDLAKKYREISTALTGYQIKLKDVDEGICCVNSVYDETEKQYIGERHSIPGFLAAVTLQLEARRDDEEVERTQTFIKIK